MKGIEKITERILGDANAFRDELIARASKEAEETRGEYAEKAKALFEAEEAAAKKEAEAILSRSFAAAETQKRNLLLGAKGAAVDRAFDRALGAILALPGDEYFALLSSLCSKMIEEALDDERAQAELIESGEIEPCSSYEIALSAEDTVKYGEKLVRAMKPKTDGAGKTLKLSAPAPIDGGAVLRTGDIENNCSLSRLLAQVRREEEGTILSVLFPPAE